MTTGKRYTLYGPTSRSLLFQIIVIVALLKSNCVLAYYDIPDKIKLSNDQIQVMVEQLVLKLNNAPELADVSSIAITRVENATREHLRMSYIEDQLSAKALTLTDLRVVDSKHFENVIAERERSLAEAENVDERKAVRQSLGVDALLSGKITAFPQQKFTEESITYTLVLKVSSTDAGEVLWTGEESVSNKTGMTIRNSCLSVLLVSLTALAFAAAVSAISRM